MTYLVRQNAAMTTSNDAFDRVARRRAVVPARDSSYLPESESAIDTPIEIKNFPKGSKAGTQHRGNQFSQEVTRHPEKEDLMTVTIRVTKGLNEQTKQYFQPSLKRGNFSTFVQAAFDLLSQENADLNIEQIRNQVFEKSAVIAEKRTQEGKRKRVMTMYDNEMKGS
jgi:hypothetical protein